MASARVSCRHRLGVGGDPLRPPPAPSGCAACIEVVEAAHPVPDEALAGCSPAHAGLGDGQATGQPLTEHDPVLCLVSAADRR